MPPGQAKDFVISG